MRIARLLGISILCLGMASCGGGGGGGGGASTPPVTNQPPVVNAGPDQTVTAGATVQLSGSASDSDGSIVTYKWDQTSGPNVTISNASSPTASFVAPSPLADTTLDFRLTATDNNGSSRSDLTTVTVKSAPVPPTVDAGVDQVSFSCDSVLLSATATDTDGRIETYIWRQLSGPEVILNSPTSAETTFIAPETNADVSITMEVVVTDNSNLSASDQVTVTVQPREAGAPLTYVNGRFPEGFHFTVCGGPYKLGGVEVPYGGVVTIDPGVSIYDGFLAIEGALRVNGTSQQPVRFLNAALLTFYPSQATAPDLAYDWKIAHAIFDDYAYIDNGRQPVGTLEMIDSVYLWDGNHGSGIVFQSSPAGVAVERNVFLSAHIRILSRTNESITFKNNAAIFDGRLWDIRSIEIAAEVDTALDFKLNTFVPIQYSADNCANDLYPYRCLVVARPLSGALDLTDNYWGTVDPQQISTYIRGDNVLFEPFLLTPDPVTPDPQPYIP